MIFYFINNMSTELKKSKTVSLSNKQYLEEKQQDNKNDFKEGQYMINGNHNMPVEKSLSNNQNKRNTLLTPITQYKIKTEATDSSKFIILL
jgi:hypothetical protein